MVQMLNILSHQTLQFNPLRPEDGCIPQGRLPKCVKGLVHPKIKMMPGVTFFFQPNTIRVL